MVGDLINPVACCCCSGHLVCFKLFDFWFTANEQQGNYFIRIMGCLSSHPSSIRLSYCSLNSMNSNLSKLFMFNQENFPYVLITHAILVAFILHNIPYTFNWTTHYPPICLCEDILHLEMNRSSCDMWYTHYKSSFNDYTDRTIDFKSRVH